MSRLRNLLIALGLVFVAGLVVDRYSSWQMPYDGYRQLPYRPQISAVVKDEPVVTTVRPVEHIAPRPKAKREVERLFSLDLDKVDLLSVVDVRPSENGTRVATTIDAQGHIDTVVRDIPPPALSLGGRWAFGGGIAWDLRDGLGGTFLMEKRMGSVLGLKLEARSQVSIFQNGNTDARVSLVLMK